MGKLDDVLKDAPGMGWGGTDNYDQCKADIKDLMRSLISECRVTYNKGGSGEFTQLDEGLLREKIAEL